MKVKKNILPLLGVLLLFYSCQQKPTQQHNQSIEKKFALSIEQAKNIFDMPVHCLTVEYPNKLGQTIGSASDLKTPKQLRPIFYGCFDWHSSAHGYWSIVKLLKAFPEFDTDGKIRTLLNEHITVQNVTIEQSFFEDINNKNFERTYGWAWLFKLQEELAIWDDPDAKRWHNAFEPLVELLINRYIEYLPNLVYPVRHGKHENSAFGLSLSLDYALTAKHEKFKNAIVEHAKRLFSADKNCDLAYEPSGSDFLSPCLEEAYLMSKIMDESSYRTWLKGFMPDIFKTDFELAPGIVKDRADGQLVHLDGLNYSRAACLYGISSKLSELQYLRAIADDHLSFTLPNLSKEDDYMGSHWLGTFALYALSHQ